MKIQKYNGDTKKYEEPIECDTVLFTDNMDLLVECPYCHKKVRLGDTYSEGDFYDISGCWKIPVCEECAKKIWEEYKNE